MFLCSLSVSLVKIDHASPKTLGDLLDCVEYEVMLTNKQTVIYCLALIQCLKYMLGDKIRGNNFLHSFNSEHLASRHMAIFSHKLHQKKSTRYIISQCYNCTISSGLREVNQCDIRVQLQTNGLILRSIILCDRGTDLLLKNILGTAFL